MKVLIALKIVKEYHRRTKSTKYAMRMELKKLDANWRSENYKNLSEKFAKLNPICDEFGYISLALVDYRTKKGKEFKVKGQPFENEYFENMRKINDVFCSKRKQIITLYQNKIDAVIKEIEESKPPYADNPNL